MFRTNLSLTYLGGATVLLEYGQLRILTDPGFAVARGLAPFETCVVSSTGGERLLVTATPGQRLGAATSDVSTEVAGFALGRDRPGDLFYATGESVWCDEMARVADRLSPKVIYVAMGDEGVVAVAHAFPDAVIVTTADDRTKASRGRSLVGTPPLLGGDKPSRLRILHRGKKLRFNIAA